jgi:hypothetical protein
MLFPARHGENHPRLRRLRTDRTEQTPPAPDQRRPAQFLRSRIQSRNWMPPVQLPSAAKNRRPGEQGAVCPTLNAFAAFRVGTHKPQLGKRREQRLGAPS